MKEENRLADDQFTRIYVPVRVGGHWLAVVCDMGCEKCDWVTFDDWEHEKVRFVAQEVSYHLRQTALQCELLTRKKLMEEMMIPDWRLEEAIDFYTKEGSH